MSVETVVLLYIAFYVIPFNLCDKLKGAAFFLNGNLFLRLVLTMAFYSFNTSLLIKSINFF